MGKTRSFRIVVVAVASLAIIAGTAAAPAFARGDGCAADPATGTPFAAWGDTASYVLAPGGGTRLDDGESLTTACVKVIQAQPIVRFFAQSSSNGGNGNRNGNGGNGNGNGNRNGNGSGNGHPALHVELLVPGTGLVLDGGLVTATNTMAPVAQVVLQYGFGNGATPLEVRLTALGGTFNIGDVYIDPFVQKAGGVN